MTLLWILGGFLVFMAAIRGVQFLDDYAFQRYGYAPFSMPNLLFMLIPNGLLLFAIRDAGADGARGQVLMTLASAAMLGMILLVKSRTNGWIALVAAPLMLFGAPVLVFSVLFRGLARAGD